MVKLTDIAKEAGVSLATVSKVMNGKAQEARIGEDCARHVAEVAARMGYRANRAARAVASGKFDTIGLLKVRDQGIGLGQLPEGLLNGIESRSTEAGLQLRFISVPAQASAEDTRELRNSWGDGLLVFGCWQLTQSLRQLFEMLHLPVIYVGIQEEQNCLYPNEYDACCKATTHLLELGHQRIAYIPDNHLARYAQEDRLAAYTDTMRKAGLAAQVVDLPPQRRVMEVYPAAPKQQEREAFLLSDQRPTAVIADSTELAYPLLLDATRLGISVPQQLSLLTFHDVIASQLGPSLSTMVLHTSEMGQQAVDLLRERIARKESIPSVKANYELVQAETTMEVGS